MIRYYIRLSHSGFLLREGPTPHWTKQLDEATGFLSYGDAHCSALELKKNGYAASAVNEYEARLSLSRITEEGSPCRLTA